MGSYQAHENHHKAKWTWRLNFHKCDIVSVWGVTPLSSAWPYLYNKSVSYV